MKGYEKHIQEGLIKTQLLKSTGINTYGLEISSGCGSIIRVAGKDRINFISNSYMGFSTHPKVIEAVQDTVKKYGMGIGGSPLACGTTSLHLKLAERLADNFGTESALVFASGYKALAGTIQGLMGRGDIALVDGLAHRSIIDGCLLAGCKVRSFKHNDMDDLADLIDRTSGKDVHRMVIVDSVYSMDGDVAQLPEMSKLCKAAGVTLLIDEAHSLGIMGRTGRGLMEYFDMPKGADVVAGTFSKFAGAVGGYAAGDRDMIEHLRYFSSPYVFSASIPPAVVAAILASFDLLKNEPEWLDRLWNNVNYLLDGLGNLGFDTDESQTPVIPVMIRDTQKVLRMNRMLLDEGVFASPVIHPGVPMKKERIRIGVMATHTQEQLDRALEAFAKVGRKFKVIGKQSQDIRRKRSFRSADGDESFLVREDLVVETLDEPTYKDQKESVFDKAGDAVMEQAMDVLAHPKVAQLIQNPRLADIINRGKSIREEILDAFNLVPKSEVNNMANQIINLQDQLQSKKKELEKQKESKALREKTPSEPKRKQARKTKPSGRKSPLRRKRTTKKPT
jgi:glycine C-acetyltransferase